MGRRRPSTRSRHGRSRWSLLSTVVVSVGLVGSLAVAAPTAAAPTAAAPTVPPLESSASTVDGWEWFSGSVDDFYRVPAPLPVAAPGQLIRIQPIGQNASSVSVRIMYHSRDAQDRDRAVTGVLTFPKQAPPPGGWPVISNAPGTSGLAPQCALSRRTTSSFAWGVPVVAVTTDYIGLGPVGERHPYMSRLSEGHSVIDAVRAARDLSAANAGTRWLATGGSQGGHAALAANELGETYAPELDLLGSVALAPGAMFDRTYMAGLDPFVARVVTAMGLYGAATEYPQIDPHDYVTPAVQAAESVLDTGCLGEITGAFVSIPYDGFWSHDPLQTEPARSVILGNDVGHVRVESPVLIPQGTADLTVVPQRTRDLVERMCAVGQVVSLREYDGADHNNVQAHAFEDTKAWIEARLRAEPAPDSCPPPVAVPGAGRRVEGDSGARYVRVPVTLSRPASHPVTVRWRTGFVPGLVDQAEPSVDYRPQATDRVLTFAPGQTTAYAEVVVLGDTRVEADELIVLAFGRATGATVGGFWGLGFGTIVDDD